MATQGPNSPASASDTGTGFAVDPATSWLNTGNILSSDNAYATAVVASAYASRLLRAGGFGFSVPIGSIITNVQFEVEAKGSHPTVNAFNLYALRFYDDRSGGAGQIGSATLPTYDSIQVTPSDSYISYSNASWNGAVGLLTPDLVNDANFCIDFSFAARIGGETISVDHVRATLTYTPPSPGIGIKPFF